LCHRTLERVMEKVLFSNEEYGEALEMLNQLMRDAEQISNVDHKVLLYNVLQYFDSIHREPILRIMNALESNPALKNDILKDETVQKLCALYDIVIEENPPQKEKPAGFIPVEEVTYLTPPKQKDWIELGNYRELEDQKLYAKNYERVNFLVSRVGSEVFAVQNQCDGSLLPIDKGVLEDHYIICPWHGCKYDLKTGHSVNINDKKLDTFQVEIEDNGLLKVEIAY